MNFEDERYVRVYTRKTITFKRLGWEGRTVLWHLMLEADRAGIVEIGDGDEVEAVTTLIDVPEDIVRTGLSRLSSHGVMERHGTSLVITRFIEAQEAIRSDRARAREYRDRQRSKTVSNVTPSDGTITHRDESSRGVTSVTKRHSVPDPVPVPVLGAVTPPASAPSEPKPKVLLTDGTGTHSDPFLSSFAHHAIERHAFDAWAKAFGKQEAVYDSRRAACLEERVRAGMTSQDADDAIAGAKLDAYVTGEKTGKKNDRLIFIFGDQERFEEFRDAGRAKRIGNSDPYSDTGNLDRALRKAGLA